jgi:hypothetical protein
VTPFPVAPAPSRVEEWGGPTVQSLTDNSEALHGLSLETDAHPIHFGLLIYHPPRSLDITNEQATW